MESLQHCCAVNMYYGKGRHSSVCPHAGTPVKISLRERWRELRAWWYQRGRHNDMDPSCMYWWDGVITDERCLVCNPPKEEEES